MLDGLWRFTFSSDEGQSETVEDLRLAVDGEGVLITPVVDGRSRIDQRRPGSVKGSPDSFTLDAEWPALGPLPAGCTVSSSRRTLRGRALESSLSGTFAQRQVVSGDGCPEQPPVDSHGRFGAARL
ncbi:MAG: hypothetical protein FJ125_00710 [Deltaproteobacteria bacterium]|nr:hypothetical protein [Deltaproteobacteria bacterium]